MAMAPTVCVLGLGKMGGAAARRLRDSGCTLSVWNRSSARTQALLSEARADGAGDLHPAGSASHAIQMLKPHSTVLVLLSSTANVLDCLKQTEVQAQLRGHTLVNLTSGSPADGRAVAESLASTQCHYVDGAYCGGPAKVQRGGGQLFLSSASEDACRACKPLLQLLGQTTFCGQVGASRAVDYAAVDMAFVTLSAFVSNVAMLEREGADVDQAIRAVAQRLDTVPDYLSQSYKRMQSRDEAAYARDPVATLATWRSFWASRLPYFEQHGMPTHLPHFAIRLLDGASGGVGEFKDADVTRLQEVLRYADADRAESAER